MSEIPLYRQVLCDDGVTAAPPLLCSATGPCRCVPAHDCSVVEVFGMVGLAFDWSSGSRCCIRICSSMVGVPHRPLLPSLPTWSPVEPFRSSSVLERMAHAPSQRMQKATVEGGRISTRIGSQLTIDGSTILQPIEHDDCNVLYQSRVQINPLHYRGTSLIRNRTPLGPYRRPMPRVLGGS